MSAFDGYRENCEGLGRLVAGGTMTGPHKRRRGIGGTALLAAIGIALAGAILGTLFFW